MNWLYFSNNHNEFTTVWPEYDETSNEKFAWIHWSSAQLRFHHILVGLYFFPLFTLNSLSFSQNHYKFTICFVISLWIHYLFCDCFVNLLSICEFTIYWIHDLFGKTTIDLAIHFQFTVCFAISLWIHYLFREFTLNSLFYSRNH